MNFVEAVSGDIYEQVTSGTPGSHAYYLKRSVGPKDVIRIGDGITTQGIHAFTGVVISLLAASLTGASLTGELKVVSYEDIQKVYRNGKIFWSAQ